jgi:hypothetical protein
MKGLDAGRVKKPAELGATGTVLAQPTARLEPLLRCRPALDDELGHVCCPSRLPEFVEL